MLDNTQPFSVSDFLTYFSSGLDTLPEGPIDHGRCLTIADWFLKALFMPFQSLQWGRLVFGVVQLLEGRSPLIPAPIENTIPAWSIGATGYAVNGLVTLALIDLTGIVKAMRQLQGEYCIARAAADKKEQAKIALKCLFGPIFTATGVMYWWPVVGEPAAVNNQSYANWAGVYDYIDHTPWASWLNCVTYGVATMLIMGTSGIYLAHSFVESITGIFRKSPDKEVKIIEEKLSRLFLKPNLEAWFEVVEKEVSGTQPHDLSYRLTQTLINTSPETLALAALYKTNRESQALKAAEVSFSLVITFILNYGFIPFTLAVFRTLSSLDGALSAVVSLMATLTNCVLTSALSDEIFHFLKSLTPCRAQPASMQATIILVALINLYMLVFSSFSYLPDAFSEAIATCAYDENITHISFSGNQNVSCPDHAEVWFGVQVALTIANPFLFNLSVMIMLSTKLYEAIFASCKNRYKESYAWFHFRQEATEKLKKEAYNKGFIQSFVKQLLRNNRDQYGKMIGEMFCAFVYENRLMMDDSSLMMDDSSLMMDDSMSHVRADVVFKKLVDSDDIRLPQGLESARPFETRKWMYLKVLVSVAILFASAIYYCLDYESDNSTNQSVPRLPQLQTKNSAFVMVALLWLSAEAPQLMDAIRLHVQKGTVLSCYEKQRQSDALAPWKLAAPMVDKKAYYGWQVLAGVTAIPLLMAGYYLCVSMLEAAVELNLHTLDPKVEAITAVAFQLFTLIALALLIGKYQDVIVKTGLRASCYKRNYPGPAFHHFTLTPTSFVEVHIEDDALLP